MITSIDATSMPSHGFSAGFFHDSTGSIYIEFPAGMKDVPTPGTLVDVQGQTGPGLFAPIISRENQHLQIRGHAALPADPARDPLNILESGTEDAKWVEADGIIHSVINHQSYVTMQMAMVGGTVGISLPVEPGIDYSRYIDAKVRVQANAAPLFNLVNQIMGVTLLAPGASSVKILQPPPADPFQLPVLLIDQLLRWDHLAEQRHRVHTRGRVTLLWPAVSFCVQDSSRGICAQTAEDAHLALGDVVDVVGFVDAVNGTPVMTDAIYKKIGPGDPIAPQTLSAAEVLQGRNDSEIIQLNGRVIGVNSEDSDTVLQLISGATIYTALLPNSITRDAAKEWKPGSTVQITGICSMKFDEKTRSRGEGIVSTRSFRVLLRSPKDVVIVEGPSWWTPVHMISVLTIALLITLIALVWAIVLRRRLKRQAELLRKSEERFRHMALHDHLTKLATRLLFEDRLHVAWESSSRYRTGMALLILDVDRFKTVNDTYGHQAGDEVLRITASRILAIVRSIDTVARLGGDEFAVLLPELPNSYMAKSIASRIIEAMSAPIQTISAEISASVSIGLCFTPGGTISKEELMKRADAALYEAKQQGRGRFECIESVAEYTK
jgi:diguanylate cyclase (GGDEF)-like protein